MGMNSQAKKIKEDNSHRNNVLLFWCIPNRLYNRKKQFKVHDSTKCSIILELNDRSCRITNASIMKYSICRNCCYSAWIAKLSETIKILLISIDIHVLTTLRIEIDVPGIVLIFWKMSLLFNLQKKEPSRECFNRSEGMLWICICFPSLDLHS